jgi:hypothetical protein
MALKQIQQCIPNYMTTLRNDKIETLLDILKISNENFKTGYHYNIITPKAKSFKKRKI